MKRDTYIYNIYIYIHAHKECKRYKETCWIIHPAPSESHVGAILDSYCSIPTSFRYLLNHSPDAGYSTRQLVEHMGSIV